MSIRLFQHLPLSRKILLGIVPLFLIFISLSVSLHNHFQEQEMMKQAQLSAHTYADIVKESLVSMMVNNLEVDGSFLDRLNAVQQFDTLHILVNNLRLRDELLTPVRLQRLKTKYSALRARDETERNVLATGQPVFSRDGDRFRGTIPFNATAICQKCHAVPIGYTLGATDVHISFKRFTEASQENWRRSLLIFIAFTALAITVATLMFRKFIAKPIDRLVIATRKISDGELDYHISDAHPPGFARSGSHGDGSRDEVMFLALKFDEMRESLKEKMDQLDQVNKHLLERNREVEDALRRLRQAQEDLVKSERLAVTGKLTAQLSHEINNPIHNIQSLLDSSLRKMNGNSQAKELIGVAREEVSRMAKLIRQMLNFYRGSVSEFEREYVDVHELLAELVRMNEEPLAQQRVSIALDCPRQLPHIHGSRDKLKQVFLNLILNARDAMPHGGRITIKASLVGSAIRVGVTDTGVGIRPEHMNKIFDAFFTTKNELSGVGLGLSVSYAIVQQHNGTIEVESKVGAGTTFTIQLPAEGETHGQS